MQVGCILLLEDHRLEPIAEACIRFSPQIALGERAIFIEIGRNQRLYTAEALLPRLRALMNRFGVKARISFAEDIPTALALATFAKTRKDELPIEALQVYANPFRRSDSLEKAIETFRRLGVTTLKEFLDIPVKSLAARFNKEGLLVRHHIDSVLSLPWPRFVPSEKIVEAFDVDDAFLLRNLEPLVFLFRGMIDRALLRSRGRGELATAVEVRIFQEPYSSVRNPMRLWTLEFAFPQGSVISVLPIIRERLERDLNRIPLESPVRRVEFEIVKAVPGQARQKDFFSKKEEEEEGFRSVVARLTERMGPHRVFMASPIESYIPERSWKRTLTHVSKVEVKVAERPLRVLKRPQALRWLDDYLIHRQKKWLVREMQGPERLSGEWWAEEGERDYYRVKTASGEELWIYSTPNTHDYFLHGIFD